MKRLWIFGFAALLCACPNQEDVTPMIHVTPGAANRAFLMSRGKQPNSAEISVHNTRISILEKGKELGGPNAVGRPGDLILENDEVAFVIDQLGSGSGFEQSGGNLVDAADAKVRKDELGQLFTFFGEFPRQAVYDKIASAIKDGVGVVTSSGHELRDANLIVTTTYTLHPNDRALLIETTIENRGSAPSAKLGLGDAIQWGAADKFAPGKPAGFKGPTKGPFLGGFGRYVSYAITSTDGDIEAVNGSSWSDTFQKRDVILAPKEKVHYARVFIVGERADSSSVIAELTKAAAGKTGLLAIDMADPAGNQVMLNGGKISLSQNGAEVMSVATSVEGTQAEVPLGEYDAFYVGGGGRSATGKPQHVVVKDAQHVVIGVTDAAHLDLACTDVAWSKPMPCKFTFESLENTPPIDFGPASAAGPAKNQITTATGTITDLPISPGKYRITASRGPEYTIAQKEMRLAPGGRESFAGALRQVLDVDGYVGCDFHQHSMLGADAPTSTIDRVISNVAEGVRVAVASEHNVVADLEPLVKEANLDGELVEISGDEVTSDAAKIPWGHMNVFPLVRDNSDPRGGAFDASKPPSSFIDAAAKITAPHVVQVNHPRAWNIGYFDLAKFDASIGAGTAPWYDGRFDAIELWNGRNVESRDKVRADYFSLLLHGHVVTPTANTDTHGVVGQEAGYPRTYVRVENTGNVKGWDVTRTNDLVKGLVDRRDVVLTNGPFLRVSVNKAAVGGIAKATGGKAVAHIFVSAAPWVSVERVGIAFASGAIVEKKISLKPTKSGATSASIDVPIHVNGDDAVSIYAAGDKPLSPVLTGDAKEIAPYAMTGAIWIDGDGDGKSLGR